MTKIIDIVLGFISCFFGYRFSKAILSIFGFIIGYKFGMQYLPSYTLQPWMNITISIIIGLIAGFISYKLYLIGIFALCATVVYSLCQTIGIDESLRIIIGLTAGIIAGIIGVNFTKPLIIVTTSLSGTTLLVKTISSVVSFKNPILYMILYIIIAIYSINYQLKQEDGNID